MSAGLRRRLDALERAPVGSRAVLVLQAEVDELLGACEAAADERELVGLYLRLLEAECRLADATRDPVAARRAEVLSPAELEGELAGLREAPDESPPSRRDLIEERVRPLLTLDDLERCLDVYRRGPGDA